MSGVTTADVSRTARTDSMPFLSVASIPMTIIVGITIEGSTDVIETGPVLPFFGTSRGAPRGGESMSDDTDERLIKPPVVVESFGDLDGKSRSAIRRAAVGATVDVLANRVRELCAAFDELDADGLGNDAQEALWRAYDLMEDTCSALDEAGRDGEDGP